MSYLLADSLSDALRTVHFHSAVYFQNMFCDPWGMAIADGTNAQFHYLVSGQCQLLYQNQEIGVNAGDFILFPHGDAHRLADKRSTACVPGTQVVQLLQQHGNQQRNETSAGTTLICGHFSFDAQTGHPIVAGLPGLLLWKSGEMAAYSDLRLLLDLLIRESRDQSPGASAAATRLAEVLFIKLLQTHFEQPDVAYPFMAALFDPVVGEAITLIHTHYRENWSLNDLAYKAGASTSSLVQKFKSTLQMTPMKYLNLWRMLKSREMLQDTTRPLLDIAYDVGYNSEGAFIRAFKQRYGISPGRWRSAAR